MARLLEIDEAAALLEQRGLSLNSWNGLTSSAPADQWLRSSFCTGMSIYELVNFSQHIAGWLLRGKWKILQIDNSSAFMKDQALLLCSLILGREKAVDLNVYRTFLFEFTSDDDSNFQTECVLAHIIYLMLVYEAHCFLVSAEGGLGEMLAIQDGFVYFYGRADRLSQAREITNQFDHRSTIELSIPSWMK